MDTQPCVCLHVCVCAPLHEQVRECDLDGAVPLQYLFLYVIPEIHFLLSRRVFSLRVKSRVTSPHCTSSPPAHGERRAASESNRESGEQGQKVDKAGLWECVDLLRVDAASVLGLTSTLTEPGPTNIAFII